MVVVYAPSHVVKKIITITSNPDVFYEPQITDISKCTNCGLCINICAYTHNELSVDKTPLANYASWSKDAAVRRKCSSGRIGFEVSRTLIKKATKFVV